MRIRSGPSNVHKVSALHNVQASKTVKGGGLFGMFQQDTVYADEGAAAPPSQTEVERAVTKRGMGPPKRRKGGAKQLQASAKEVRYRRGCVFAVELPLDKPRHHGGHG